MKEFLKTNWFKLSILVAVLIVAIFVSYYFTAYLPKQNEIKSIQTNKFDELQAQLLNTQKELAAEKAKQLEVKATLPQQSRIPIIQQDPAIKIEKCKTQAKDYADKLAKNMYLKAFEAANARGDNESARFFMEASFKPEHPADYDSNYNSAYINCLNN